MLSVSNPREPSPQSTTSTRVWTRRLIILLTILAALALVAVILCGAVHLITTLLFFAVAALIAFAIAPVGALFAAPVAGVPQAFTKALWINYQRTHSDEFPLEEQALADKQPEEPTATAVTPAFPASDGTAMNE